MMNKTVQTGNLFLVNFDRQDCREQTARTAKMAAMGKKDLPVLKAHQVKTAKMDRMGKTDRTAKMASKGHPVHQVLRGTFQSTGGLSKNFFFLFKF